MTIDWKDAPEGAQWHVKGTGLNWYKSVSGDLHYWHNERKKWEVSLYTSLDNLKADYPTLTPRPSEPKPYTRDEALQFLVKRLDSWPTDIADAPLCPGWGWESEDGESWFAENQSPYGMITRDSWNTTLPDFVPFVSLEDSQPISGQKFDTGKPIIGAIPPHAELAVARVMTFGAQKYARDNWRKIDDIPTRYMDAALRHLNAVRRGETADPESGEHHLAHAACCILFMLDVVEASDAQTDR